MRTARLLASIAFIAVLGHAPIASAETLQLGALREAVRELDVRAKSVRERAESAEPRLRSESKRIVDRVDERRVFIATRLELVELVASDRSGAHHQRALAEIEAAYHSASKLLAIVEGWYRPR
jgi:hypothetical protein